MTTMVMPSHCMWATSGDPQKQDWEVMNGKIGWSYSTLDSSMDAIAPTKAKCKLRALDTSIVYIVHTVWPREQRP